MRYILSLLVFGLLPTAGFGQTELIRQTSGSSVTAEFLLINFKNPIPGFTSSGFAGILSGDFEVGDRFNLQIEIPYVETKSDFSSPFGSSSSKRNSVGNLYLGVGMGDAEDMVSGRFGVRLPTFPESKAGAGYAGVTGDFPNYERYISDAIIVSGGVNFRGAVGDKFGLVATVIPAVWFPTKGQGRDTEILVYYGGGPTFTMDFFRVSAGINGLLLLTEKYFVGQKSTLHHLQIEANTRFGMVRPGVMFRLPLEKELDQTVASTVGVYVSVLF